MADLIEYKCPTCGGKLEFDASLQKMKCPYCDSTFEMSQVQALDEDAEGDLSGEGATGADDGDINEDDYGGRFDAEQKGEAQISSKSHEWDDAESEGMSAYSCASCGAEIIADKTTGASNCPYCGNVVVMKDKFSGTLRPDLLIPFKFTKKQAAESYEKYIKSKRFVPRVFSENGHPEEIKGVYIPFWLYDARLRGDIYYDARNVRTWSDRDFNYTETEYYKVRRAGYLNLEKVPVDASSKMPNDLTESIEPYNAEEAVPFTTAYLAGYMADRYDVDASASKDRAFERMKNSLSDSFRSSVTGYSLVTQGRTSIAWDKGTSHYALYPAWILSTKWEDKNYLFAMNGQTGKFIGELPVDKNALRNFTIKLTLGLGFAFYIILMLLLSM